MNSRVRNLPQIVYIIIIILLLGVSLAIIFYLISSPSEKVLINIVVKNGIEINGSDSNIINPTTESSPDSIAIVLVDEEIQQLNIIESGYDIIDRKYFAIVEVVSYSDEYHLNAKLMMLLKYDNGWKVCEKIGVLNSNFDTK
ncbi:MAG: hypothetical protein R6U59_06615 [Eubacteriales bacterium]